MGGSSVVGALVTAIAACPAHTLGVGTVTECEMSAGGVSSGHVEDTVVVRVLKRSLSITADAALKDEKDGDKEGQ